MNRSYLISHLQKLIIQHSGEADRRAGPDDVYRHALNSLIFGDAFTYCLRSGRDRFNFRAFCEESVLLRVLMVPLTDVNFLDCCLLGGSKSFGGSCYMQPQG
jgi:hypothetical protein